jgi:carnosine N-methyltransferase
VLVPGCGLGRLPWEVARRGYVALGCEFSFFMLFASNFVLNGGLRPDELTVQPYVHARSNVWRAANTLRAVRLPDVDVAAGLGAGSQLAIAAGDLLEVLDGQEPASWDAVLTCFFVDTARNIFDYVEALRRALRPNGWWFNLGPLTYHWAHDRDVPALELSYEQLRLVVRAAGFDIVEEDEQLAYYCDDPSAMMRTHYRCAVFAARLRAADAL